MAKINTLESIRGLGALSVVFFHYLEVFYPAFVTGNPSQSHLRWGIDLFFYRTPLNVFYNGTAAVLVFFVLSGYVLTFKFFKTGDTQHLASGIVRRYFRLLPIVLFAEIGSYLCLRYSLYHAKDITAITLANTWTGAYSLPADLGAVLKEAFFGIFFRYESTYNVPFWTMTYELFGSMLVYITAYVTSSLRHRQWIYFGLVLFLWDSYYCPFVLGMILSDLSNRPEQPLRKLNFGWLNLILGAAGLLMLSFPYHTDFIDASLYRYFQIPWIANNQVFYYTWGAFLLILVGLNSRWVQKLLALRPFLFLGRISYPMYAIHWIVLGSFSSFLFLKLAPIWHYKLGFLATFGASILLIFGIADLAWRFIDTPGIRLSGWIYEKFFRRAKGLDAAVKETGT